MIEAIGKTSLTGSKTTISRSISSGIYYRFKKDFEENLILRRASYEPKKKTKIYY